MSELNDFMHSYGSTQTVAEKGTDVYPLPYDLHGIFSNNFISEISYQHFRCSKLNQKKDTQLSLSSDIRNHVYQ